jgi:hypothetical protein
LSRPLKLQIIEQARALIADERRWCRRHLAHDVNGVAVSPTSTSAVKRCALGAVIAAAYELTHDLDAAHQLGHGALRPRYGAATLIHVNDVRGHAAVLALFDEVIAAALAKLRLAVYFPLGARRWGVTDANSDSVSGPRGFSTKTSCPKAVNRRVNVPPIWPAPMIPIFILL